MSFGASFAAGAGVMQNKAQLQQQQQALQQKERQQMIENINSIADKELGVIRGLHEGAAKKGMSFDDPEFQGTIKPMVDDLMALLGRGNPMFPGEVMSQEQAMRLVGSIPMTIATPKDEARLNRFTAEELESDPSIPPGFAQLARDGFLVERNQHGMMVVSAAVAPDDDPDKREARILDVMQLYGVDRKTAVSVVDPNIARIETDPQGGVTRYINNVTGEVRELPILPASGASIHGGGRSPASGVPSPGGSPAPSPEQPEAPAPSASGRTLYELAGIATGPVAAARAGLELSAGFLPEGMQVGVLSQEVTEAKQRFESEGMNLRRALANSPKFAEGEQQRITKEIDVLPKFFSNAAVMRAKMRGLDYTLEQRHADAIRDASDTQLPRETRSHARQSARAIENFRRQMGVPEPLNLYTIEDVQSADVETLRSFINTASDDDLVNLPDDIVDEILKKVKGQ